MRLVVIGLGYTATVFAHRLRDRGWEVHGSVRSTEKAERLASQGFAMHVFDGSSVPPGLADAIDGADALLISAQPADEGDPALRSLSERIAAAPSLNWIGYLSTIGVYGDAGGAWIDETAPCRPSHARTQQRVVVEHDWIAFGAAHGKPVQIFRLAGIYGPGRSQIVNLRAGTARRLVKPGQVFNRIHVEDIAGVLEASQARPRPGAIYNVSDDEPAPPQDVVAHAAGLIGVAPPPEQAFDPATLSPMAASFYGDNKRVSNALVKRELGYVFRYPTYREGLAALVAAGE